MKRISIFILFLLLFGVTYSQTKISDANFAQTLCTRYPNLMNATCDTLRDGPASFLEPVLDISNSNISSVTAEITRFRRADTILANNNNLTKFLDVIKQDELYSLVHLNISNNQIVEFPFVNPDVKKDTLSAINPNVESNVLQYWYFENNRATSIQNFWGLRDTIQVLDISGNYISSIQDLGTARNASLIDLRENYFTFEDLIPHTDHPSYDQVFMVFPQRKIRWPENEVTGNENESFELHVPVDSFVTTNTYEWYRDGDLVTSTIVNTLEFSSLKLSDEGTYTVRITNSTPELSVGFIETEEIDLSVNSCMDVNSLHFEQEPLCIGSCLRWNSADILGGTAPYIFEFVNNNTDVIQAVDSSIHLTSGDYIVNVTDMNGCVRAIDINVSQLPACDEYVITPDGDGFQDKYYFSQEGKGIIYNQFGQVITELTLPSIWDAKDTQGNIITPGKYVMIINEKQRLEIKVVW